MNPVKYINICIHDYFVLYRFQYCPEKINKIYKFYYLISRQSLILPNSNRFLSQESIWYACNRDMRVRINAPTYPLRKTSEIPFNAPILRIDATDFRYMRSIFVGEIKMFCHCSMYAENMQKKNLVNA